MWAWLVTKNEKIEFLLINGSCISANDLCGTVHCVDEFCTKDCRRAFLSCHAIDGKINVEQVMCRAGLLFQRYYEPHACWKLLDEDEDIWTIAVTLLLTEYSDPILVEKKTVAQMQLDSQLYKTVRIDLAS